MRRWIAGVGVIAAMLVVGLQILSASTVERDVARSGFVRAEMSGSDAEAPVVTRPEVGRSVAEAWWVARLRADAPPTRAPSIAPANDRFVESYRNWYFGDGEVTGYVNAGVSLDLSADIARILQAAAWQEKGASRIRPAPIEKDARALGPLPDTQISIRDVSDLPELVDVPIAAGEEADPTVASLPPIPPPSPSPSEESPQTGESDPLLATAMADAALMVSMVNQARTQAGLPPMIVDVAMAAVARAHSEDMAANGYFSHMNGAGLNPFDRMRLAGISFRGAGENIARNGSTTAAHAGLMESAGHAANILNERFTRIGIGIYIAGPNTMFFTQLFAY